MKAASVAGVAQHTLAGIEGQLIGAIDDDASAYEHVMTARKQPREWRRGSVDPLSVPA